MPKRDYLKSAIIAVVVLCILTAAGYLFFTSSCWNQQTLIYTAKKYAKSTYGEAFKGYELSSCDKFGALSYIVTFAKKYGDGDFVNGEEISIQLGYDRSSPRVFSDRTNALRDFDPTSLNGLTKRDLLAWVEEQILEKYGSVPTYEVEEIRIDLIDGCYKLLVGIEYPEKIGELTVSTFGTDVFYYDIT